MCIHEAYLAIILFPSEAKASLCLCHGEAVCSFYAAVLMSDPLCHKFIYDKGDAVRIIHKKSKPFMSERQQRKKIFL